MSYPIDAFTPALSLAAAIRHKDVSPVEVVDMYLDRMDELDPRLNAFCHRADDDVRTAASAAADVVARAGTTEDLPPFLGVPLPIKDMFDVAGWPTIHGSAGTSRVPVAASDPVVQRLVDAGFVLLGKTTTSEFGAVPFTESETLGVSRNPWSRDRTPGGSSSGAGVAVAAAMAPIAHGGDGAGSIRIPASCNGLVGLKPTRGLVTNVAVDAEGFATSGVLTRTVADTAAALDVLACHDPAAWWSPPTPRCSFTGTMTTAPPVGLRIGVLTDPPLEGMDVDPACRTAVDIAVRTLESAGHHVVDTTLPLPPTDELLATFTMIWKVALRASRSWTRTGRAAQPGAPERGTSDRLVGLRRRREEGATAVPSHRRGLRRQVRTSRHAHDGLPAAAGRLLEGRDRRGSPDGVAEQLPDGRVHVAVQRHRPTGDLGPGPSRRRHRPSRRRPGRRGTLAGRPPAAGVSHPRARASLDRASAVVTDEQRSRRYSCRG
jgi:Asp-tRNA(Asn)/Glu-tRNA(Gln) amidotransferase A subunit family amidase